MRSEGGGALVAVGVHSEEGYVCALVFLLLSIFSVMSAVSGSDAHGAYDVSFHALQCSH